LAQQEVQQEVQQKVQQKVQQNLPIEFVGGWEGEITKEQDTE
jgi:hypothetical protein